MSSAGNPCVSIIAGTRTCSREVICAAQAIASGLRGPGHHRGFRPAIGIDKQAHSPPRSAGGTIAVPARPRCSLPHKENDGPRRRSSNGTASFRNTRPERFRTPAFPHPQPDYQRPFARRRSRGSSPPVARQSLSPRPASRLSRTAPFMLCPAASARRPCRAHEAHP